MPSGGRRPGAGAPRGNRNRLRHGLASKYVQETTTSRPCPLSRPSSLVFELPAQCPPQQEGPARLIRLHHRNPHLHLRTPHRSSPPTLCPSGPQRQTGTRPQLLTPSIPLFTPYAYVNLHHPSPHPKTALPPFIFLSGVIQSKQLRIQSSFNRVQSTFNQPSIKPNQRSTKSNHPQSSPIIPQSHPIPCQPMVNPTQSLPTLQPPTFPLLAYPSPVP